MNGGDMYAKLNKRVVCTDGFTMSVQANEGAYCSPRVSRSPSYLEVEVGYPSVREEMLMPYAESPEQATDTVYAYVPVAVVTNVIAKHGGIVSGDVPPGVIRLNPVELAAWNAKTEIPTG